jgi:hypothetical protein
MISNASLETLFPEPDRSIGTLEALSRACCMGLIVVALFVAVLASLGSALYYLLRSRGGSKSLVRALTLRIGLSMLLFLLLMIAWYAGLIEPHGIRPIAPPP